MGFNAGKPQAVLEWIEIQGITTYNDMNDRLIEIIGLKNRLKPDRLENKFNDLFHLACYDLDTFRSHILDKGILDDRNWSPETLDAAMDDDEALLMFGLEWIKHMLLDTEVRINHDT